MRKFFIVMMVVLIWVSDADALVYVAQDGIYLYYPKESEQIIIGLKNKIPGMLAFLEGKGLHVTIPIHIILDEKRDAPNVVVNMIPHREIRIPLRAPGVLEEGYLEPDPWAYFLFKGLCLQGLYSLRSGIPGAAYKVVGEVVSPNIILPPWVEDGICYLLYTLYAPETPQESYETAIMNGSVPPDISKMSNHPGSWPGYYGYRIYGRPFVFWIYKTYGWDAVLDFMEIHGKGIIPIEIDLKAKKAFGKTWSELWTAFKASLGAPENGDQGNWIMGYWPSPFTYWNLFGIYPGIEKAKERSRYGYIDDEGYLWISEYDEEGVSKIVQHSKGVAIPLNIKHAWDPGKGGIAVTRWGTGPALMRCFPKKNRTMSLSRFYRKPCFELIPAPEGALQISGPVTGMHGRIAAAINRRGNWDIWIYEGDWKRITDAPSVEMDPCWIGEALVFASDISGKFQIHSFDMKQLTNTPYAGILPREDMFLSLTRNGMEIKKFQLDPPPFFFNSLDIESSDAQEKNFLQAKPYTPRFSILPNYVLPELYIGSSDFQIGISTYGRDVTDRYRIEAGVRYSSDTDYLSFTLGSRLNIFGLRASRYPMAYDIYDGTEVDESRVEGKAFWIPYEDYYSFIEMSLNGLIYDPTEGYGEEDHEEWGAIRFSKDFEFIDLWGTAEAYSGGRKSLYGGFLVLVGKEIYGTFSLQAGKTWGGYTMGHGSYRIGGDTGEGYFTDRPSRLLPLRGFESNILDSGEAITGSAEIYWPLADLQKGYKTLPLFLHRMRLGTFVDAGACADHMTKDELLIGTGLELLTSMEIAWEERLSTLRIGVSWPVKQPEYLDEEGPVVNIQVGQPL